MSKLFFNALLTGMLISAMSASATSVPARITVGDKKLSGVIEGKKNGSIAFRQANRAGVISYPIDAIKEIDFPVKLNTRAFGEMQQNREYEQMAVAIETALRPFEDYSDLPSNLARYQNVLMELYYKMGDFSKALVFAKRLSVDDRDPEMRKNAIVYLGLSLIELDRLAEAEALFATQGWTGDIQEDASAEDLYITAKFLMMKKDYLAAIETAAKIVAFHHQDEDWNCPAELLCAEIYLRMAEAYNSVDYLDSADEVIKEISLLYKDTDEADKAKNLKLSVDTLRYEMSE